jgi:antibiotic biosynthesis monooxygenase (ABM) superfamily enzyme
VPNVSNTAVGHLHFSDHLKHFSMSNLAEQAVTVLISRRVKAGFEADFERVTQQIMAAAARFSGYLGAQLVHPDEDHGVDDGLYHVVLAFDTQANLETWQHSAERAAGLAASADFILGPSTMRPVSGLALWFRPAGGSANAASAASGGAAQPPLAPPPKWKVAVVTWCGICPTVYLMFFLLGDLLAPWTLLPRIALLTMLVVALMTWVVAPQLTRLFKPWLYARSAVSTGSTDKR